MGRTNIFTHYSQLECINDNHSFSAVCVLWEVGGGKVDCRWHDMGSGGRRYLIFCKEKIPKHDSTVNLRCCSNYDFGR